MYSAMVTSSSRVMRGAGDDGEIKSASLEADGMLEVKKKKSEMAEQIQAEEGIEIFRLKKEAFAADDLWNRYSKVPGGMELWLKEKEAAAKMKDLEPKRKKKIVKTRVTQKFIFMMRTRSHRTVSDISDEELASRSELLRQMYIMRRYIDDKWITYLNALIQQYDILGYAEDEDEITDDEDEKKD